MNAYRLIIGLCWLAFIVVWAVFAVVGVRSGARRSASGSMIRLTIFVLTIVLVNIGRFVPLAPFGQATVAVAAAGSVVCVIGVAFASWARAALGRSWGMPMDVHEDSQLVTSGPYAYVRHPIYTGLLLMMIGTALVYPLAALPTLAILAYVLFSASREEQEMQRRFPDSYPQYRRRTKRLVPFVF